MKKFRPRSHRAFGVKKRKAARAWSLEAQKEFTTLQRLPRREQNPQQLELLGLRGVPNRYVKDFDVDPAKVVSHLVTRSRRVMTYPGNSAYAKPHPSRAGAGAIALGPQRAETKPKAKKMTETFAAARKRLHSELAALGWRVSSPSLKVLWAESPNHHRIEFKPQAVYRNGHSLFLELRGLDVNTLVAAATSRL